MLVSSAAAEKVEELLDKADFYKVRHQVLYQTMLELIRRGEPVDLVTLEAALASKNSLDEVGGMTYLVELFNIVPTAANIEHYARVVKHKAQLRRLIDASNEITGACHEEQDDLDAILDRAEKVMFNVTQSRIARPYYPLKEVVNETYKTIELLFDRKAAITGVPSGLRDLDKITTGFHPSDLIILAARPSMGKTALALSFAVNIAVYDPKVPVLMFSLEMSRTQLAMRTIAMEAQIDMQLLRSGQFREEQWSSLTMACGMLSEAPIYIDDSPQISLREMRSKARRLKSEADLGLIIVDYLQLMEISDKKVESRQLEISQISRGLKQLARELSVPVIALSQLSRKVEDRTDRRPVLSDLRESGAIEQDADLVLFIFREERYKPDAEELKGRAEVIVAKQRNGPLDTAKVFFSAKYGKFGDLARESDLT